MYDTATIDFTGIISNCEFYIKAGLGVLSAILAIVAIYNRTKSNLIKSISTLISKAEAETNLSGAEKMDLVISWIKDLTPRIFSVVFNDKTWKQISQNIYDDMAEYRDKYIKNKTGVETHQVVAMVEEMMDDPQSPVTAMDNIAADVASSVKEALSPKSKKEEHVEDDLGAPDEDIPIDFNRK